MHPSKMDLEHVCKWLSTVSEEEAVGFFREQDITGEVLMALTQDELKEMGVLKLGTRKRLVQKIKKLFESKEVPAAVHNEETACENTKNYTLEIFLDLTIRDETYFPINDPAQLTLNVNSLKEQIGLSIDPSWDPSTSDFYGRYYITASEQNFSFRKTMRNLGFYQVGAVDGERVMENDILHLACHRHLDRDKIIIAVITDNDSFETTLLRCQKEIEKTVLVVQKRSELLRKCITESPRILSMDEIIRGQAFSNPASSQEDEEQPMFKIFSLGNSRDIYADTSNLLSDSSHGSPLNGSSSGPSSTTSSVIKRPDAGSIPGLSLFDLPSLASLASITSKPVSPPSSPLKKFNYVAAASAGGKPPTVKQVVKAPCVVVEKPVKIADETAGVKQSKLCFDFFNRKCVRGKKCLFAHSRDELPADVRSRFKTAMCPNEHCEYGGACHYAHSVDELPSEKQNWYKMQLCEEFSKNRHCPHGRACIFAHGASEQRGERVKKSDKKKTICEHYAGGFCRHGKVCHYLHTNPKKSEEGKKK